jgi:hypothetical protein
MVEKPDTWDSQARIVAAAMDIKDEAIMVELLLRRK